MAEGGYKVDELYEDAYSIQYDWDDFLPEEIYKFHELLHMEFNAPVSLQMGTLLPFIAALCGPTVKGRWSTRPNVLNFFTMNIAASGVGKTICRKKLVKYPLIYILSHVSNKEKFPDMEVNKFTRAGIHYI